MTKRVDKFEGLTPEERKFIRGLGRVYEHQSKHPLVRKFAKFVVEQQRLHFLMEKALTELNEQDRPTYLKVAARIHSDYQPFLDAVSAHLDPDETMGHLDARQVMTDPHSLVFSGLMTDDGYKLRESLIAWLADKPSGEKMIPLLKDLQKLMPDISTLRKKKK